MEVGITASGTKSKMAIRRISSRITFISFILYLVFLPIDMYANWLSNVAILISMGALALLLLSNSYISMTRYQFWITITLGGIVAWWGLITPFIELSSIHVLKFRKIGLYIVTATIAIQSMNRPHRIKLIWLTIACIAATIGILGPLHALFHLPFGYGEIAPPKSFLGYEMPFPRTLGTQMDYGTFGIILSMGMAYVGTAVCYPRRFFDWNPNMTRAFGGILAIGMFLGIIVAQSRSTIIAIVVVLFTLAGTISAVRGKHVISSLFLIWLSFGAVSAVSLAYVLIPANPSSVSIRVRLVKFAFDLMLQNPLFGVGWGYMKTIAPEGLPVHNLWLMAGVSMGLPGLLLFSTLFLLLLLGGLNLYLKEKPFRKIAGILILASLSGSFVELSLYEAIQGEFVIVFFAILSGTLGAAISENLNYPLVYIDDQ